MKMTVNLGQSCVKCGTENPEASIEVKIDKERNGQRLLNLYCLKCLGEEITRQQILSHD